MTIAATVALLLALPLSPADDARALRAFPLDVHRFKALDRQYDPENPHAESGSYYQTIDGPQESYIRGVYVPPLDTVTLFHEVPDQLRSGVRRMTWRWRPLVLPRNGNECANGLGDSAAAVYVTWKRGLRWYSLKFIWSTEAPLGATCNRIRNPFVASDSVVLRTGQGSADWVEETIDPEALFREHFEGGNPRADVPELQGIGVMTDGDQTHSRSAADYAGFVLCK
jgi:DUF3047 family protein